MKFVYSDGGRSKYFKGITGDCVVRAICNASGKDYKDVYNDLFFLQKSSPRNGCKPKIYKKYIEQTLGFKWFPCVTVGSGCTVHLCTEELPKGILIVRLSGHLSCVIDGVLYDSYDCSRDGTRCVYGFWLKN